MIYFIGPSPIILHEKSEMPLFSILARLKKFFDWKKASKKYNNLSVFDAKVAWFAKYC